MVVDMVMAVVVVDTKPLGGENPLSPPDLNEGEKE